MLALLAAAAYGQADPYSYEVFYTFGGLLNSAQDPLAGLIQGKDGRFYGTTSGGAPNTAGTIFRINADGSGFTELYSFNYPTDGGAPESGLIQGTDGKLYGTTSGGGTNDAGTIFSIATDGSGFTVLRTFVPATDGAYPAAALVQGTDGILYGTAAGGGVNGSGSIFSIAPDGSGFTVLHSLSGATDGATPQAALIQASDGKLYGTAVNGGPTSSGGAIFSIATNGSGFTVLRYLSYLTDGGSPFGALVQGNDGRLYGTASSGGANSADAYSGTIFSITTDGSVFMVLRSLTAQTDGAYPLAGLMQASDGNLYGTTSQGGANGYGTIFAIATDGSGFTVLHSFNLVADGGNPQAALIQAGDGNLYGMAANGGVYYAGTIFGVAPVGGGVNPVPAPPIPIPPQPVAPVIILQPVGETVNMGANAAFWAAASGLPPSSFQWNFAGAPIPGATSTILTVPNVQASDAGSYSITATNSAGTVTSNAALLTISASGTGNPLSITQQPSSQSVASGSTVAFSAQAGTGTASPSSIKTAASATAARLTASTDSVSATYQWFYEGSAIPEAIDPIYILQNATWENAGSYTCVVTDSAGVLVSNAAMLDVVTGTAAVSYTHLAKADLGMANARSAELQLQIESIGSQTADLKAQLDKAQARQSGLESQLQRALADLRSQADNARVRESDFQAVIKSSHDASSGLLKELEQAKSQAKDLEAQLAKTQGDLAKLQPLAIKARVPPLTTSFEKGFWDRGFTLHVKNLNPDPLSVNIKITGLGTAFARSATMEGGGSLNVENLAAGMRVAIESAGYDTMTVTVQ